ncbi:hypothetical protein HF638_13740 [Paenibacillus sp. SZ31]|uniref:Pycsar system effector family protein n=1 Tax=Paenibacillus sp. SZ31 TaxID=2725555 RepID=UPI00146D6E3A|nr:Pycsar system effector family protein [Paenibacillus sp. SZ31]NMI05036.1 hypothetical protein [Paenibacillus sp. SZ31]
MEDEHEKKALIGGILERTSFWIGNVDAKASFLLSITGVILGFVLSNESIEKTVDYLYYHFDYKETQSLIGLVHILIFFLAIVCITLALWAFLNTLRGKVDQKKIRQRGLEKKSLLFWGGIADRKYKEYVDDLNEVKVEQLRNDMNTQIYVNSFITTTKFRVYNHGITLLKLGLVFLVIYKFISFIPIVKP